MEGNRRWEVIIQLIKEINAKVIAEIGIYKGGTALQVLEACVLDRYWLVDYKITNYLQTYISQHMEPARYLLMRSKQAAEIVPDNSLDLCFIDVAPHSYQEIQEDTHLWKPKVKGSGIMAYHDYDHPKYPDVKLALHDIWGGDIRTSAIKDCKMAIVYV